MELHGTLGPSRTSISAVAERAGVRRSTVYRHFPDEAALFQGLQLPLGGLNPTPDPGAWAAIDDPDERLRTALEELYAYFRGTEQMLENLHRDESTVPTVKRTFSGFRGYLVPDAKCSAAAAGTPVRVQAATGHAWPSPPGARWSASRDSTTRRPPT